MDEKKSYLAGKHLRRLLHQYRVLAIVLLVAAIGITMAVHKAEQEAPPQSAEPSAAEPTPQTAPPSRPLSRMEQNGEELRGVWVPFMSLTMGEDQSESAFREKFTNIVAVAKEKDERADCGYRCSLTHCILPSGIPGRIS